MINYDRFVLENGLRVLVHEDTATPMAVVNVLYDVGARDENPEKTGFAHLFEHLMFGGSIHITDYDEPLQRAGEEYKEHYINKPYGDAWHKMRELAYTTHPYRWMTIGKNLDHIEHAKLDDVKNFFFKHYRPVNAILIVAGNVKTDEVKKLAEKWFGTIE